LQNDGALNFVQFFSGPLCTLCATKYATVVFEYNSAISSTKFVNFLPVETAMNFTD